jgi:hypothetical protein
MSGITQMSLSPIPMKPCVLRAGLKHGPPCVISLEYNAPGRGARKKASGCRTSPREKILASVMHSSLALQNITLKHVGQDGESADAITRTIIKAVEQVGQGPWLMWG